VDSISPATGATFALLPPDNATGNFTKIVQRVPVKIVFDSPQQIDSGLSASVTVDTRG
ncbi:HlyD family secretion protein, partial [Serratia sp. CY74308]